MCSITHLCLARICCKHCSLCDILQSHDLYCACYVWQSSSTCKALQTCLNFAGLVEFEGEEYLAEPDGDVEELIDSMSSAFYSLAVTGTVRVGRLCKAPQLLACWALELLEEQACHVSTDVLCCRALPCVGPLLCSVFCSVLCFCMVCPGLFCRFGHVSSRPVLYF